MSRAMQGHVERSGDMNHTQLETEKGEMRDREVSNGKKTTLPSILI